MRVASLMGQSTILTVRPKLRILAPKIRCAGILMLLPVHIMRRSRYRITRDCEGKNENAPELPDYKDSSTDSPHLCHGVSRAKWLRLQARVLGLGFRGFRVWG